MGKGKDGKEEQKKNHPKPPCRTKPRSIRGALANPSVSWFATLDFHEKTNGYNSSKEKGLNRKVI